MSDRRKELTTRLAAIEKQLFQLYGNTYQAALQIRTVREAIEMGANFTWEGNPAAERQLDRYLKQLTTKATAAIQSGVVSSYNTGEARAKDTITVGYAPTLRNDADKISEEATKEQRRQGMTAHAFATREKGGLTLSGRVWNLTANAKREIETMIQNGILEGKSPNEVSRDIRKYLNNPDALFRRVMNPKTGNLELSEAAKKYHPGTGVYRSAYKNARRLAVTEMNAAYRRAQWESYQRNPLVTGYEIRLSANHTTTIKGKIVPLTDICDQLAGRYPKTFLWTGWHPHCRCDMLPILITEADFRARIKARKNGKLDSWKPQDWQSRPVKSLPQQLHKWMSDNKQRLDRAKALPEWVEDNRAQLDLSAYDTAQWLRTYYANATGGFVATQRERAEFAKKNKQEKAKFEKEQAMCIVLANAGFKIEHLAEVPRVSSPDITINGIPADLKRTASPSNILKYAKHATRQQGARVVVFQFDEWNDRFAQAIEEVKRKGYHGYYFITGKENEVIEF